MEQERTARARAKRDYLISGALALAAAVVGIADQGAVPGAPFWTILIIVALVAAVYVRVAYGVLRSEDDGNTAPTVERMRKMTFIWLFLAVLLGAAVLRAPVSAFGEAGPSGLRARDWAAAAAGLALVIAACARAVSSLRGRGTWSGGG